MKSGTSTTTHKEQQFTLKRNPLAALLAGLVFIGANAYAQEATEEKPKETDINELLEN